MSVTSAAPHRLLGEARARVGGLLPVAGLLAAIPVLVQLCADEGLFAAAGPGRTGLRRPDRAPARAADRTGGAGGADDRAGGPRLVGA
ncbi:hypothetical protein ACFPN0_23890 [Kitasatospora cinereorecta]